MPEIIAHLLPVLKQRFYDSSGAPLVGGKLYSYSAGTTTPLVTNLDKDGTPNTNPVILDANGECDVWVIPGMSYKFVLTDLNDVVQWTVDKVSTVDVSDAVAELEGSLTTFVADAVASAEAAAQAAQDAADSLDAMKTLGLPTDGTYGATEPIAGVAENDTIEDAFDKVETVLAKLAPPKPANLSAKTLSIASTYSAYKAGEAAATLKTNVIDDTTPTIGHGATATDGFYDAENGILSAEMDSVEVGSITLSTANDEGTNGDLQIVDDYDYYAGQSGKQNFWYAIIARINSSALSLGEHVASLIHSISGTASLTFQVDDPAAPVCDSKTVTASGATRKVSGIDCFTTSATVRMATTFSQVVSYFYNSTRILSATSSCTDTVNAPLPSAGSIPAEHDTVSANIDLTVAASKFSSGLSVTATGYNSKGTSTASAQTSDIRIDSISNETTRSKSGKAQYPTKGSGSTQFGDAFDSNTLLTTADNEELQLENATFKYPINTDYSAKSPAGPDYSALAPGVYNNMRWATFNLGAVSNITSKTLTINGATNFGATALVAGISLYCLVDGATPTTGWVDANAAYPGVGNPTANGDAALDVANSTASSKKVTFGSAVKTGNFWVRIGIPFGSNKTFTSIS